MINPFKSKKGLGRGLSSLIGDSDIKDSKSNISISSIVRNKYQPRKNFEKESLEELTRSIKERGIIQPIIARRSDDQEDKFEIITGERRWQAAQNAGLHEVPVVIIKADNLKSLEFAIVENVQRKDLNPIEEAEGYKRLIDEFGYDQDKVSKFIGKSRSHITNSLRLLSLPKEVVSLIEQEKLSQGHAKVYDDVRMAAKCDPDSIYLDCMEGSTGAGPHIAAANTGIPGIAAVREARRALDDVGKSGEVTLDRKSVV